jgi:hypothetical protein
VDPVNLDVLCGMQPEYSVLMSVMLVKQKFASDTIQASSNREHVIPGLERKRTSTSTRSTPLSKFRLVQCRSNALARVGSPCYTTL